MPLAIAVWLSRGKISRSCNCGETEPLNSLRSSRQATSQSGAFFSFSRRYAWPNPMAFDRAPPASTWH